MSQLKPLGIYWFLFRIVKLKFYIFITQITSTSFSNCLHLFEQMHSMISFFFWQNHTRQQSKLMEFVCEPDYNDVFMSISLKSSSKSLKCNNIIFPQFFESSINFCQSYVAILNFIAFHVVFYSLPRRSHSVQSIIWQVLQSYITHYISLKSHYLQQSYWRYLHCSYWHLPTL